MIKALSMEVSKFSKETLGSNKKSTTTKKEILLKKNDAINLIHSHLCLK